MFKLRTIAVIFGAALCAAVASAQSQTTTPVNDKPMTVNQRLENQHDRIHAGITNDQLTKGEATRLRATDAAIRAQEQVYRSANDGRLTKGERQQLTRELNRESRQIYRDRHNNRKPKS